MAVGQNDRHVIKERTDIGADIHAGIAGKKGCLLFCPALLSHCQAAAQRREAVGAGALDARARRDLAAGVAAEQVLQAAAGGLRRKQDGSSKSAQGARGKCKAHGGGPRCSQPRCGNSAAGGGGSGGGCAQRGPWAEEGGLPAKSGVSGAVWCAIPGVGGVCAFVALPLAVATGPTGGGSA